MSSYIWSRKYTIAEGLCHADTRIDSSINVSVLPELVPQGSLGQTWASPCRPDTCKLCLSVCLYVHTAYFTSEITKRLCVMGQFKTIHNYVLTDRNQNRLHHFNGYNKDGLLLHGYNGSYCMTTKMVRVTSCVAHWLGRANISMLSTFGHGSVCTDADTCLVAHVPKILKGKLWFVPSYPTFLIYQYMLYTDTTQNAFSEWQRGNKLMGGVVWNVFG